MFRRVATVLASTAVCLAGPRLAAQGTAHQPLPASAWLAALPTADLFALLETAAPEVVSDRFNSGGINVSAPARVGGFLTSWTQTRYRLADVDITSAVDGTPLLFPSLRLWSDVDMAATVLPIASPASGLAVAMSPPAPSSAWSATIEAAASGGALTARSPAHGAPPIAALDRMTRGSGIVSGPLTTGARVVAGLEWAGNGVLDRFNARRDQRRLSLFGQVTAAQSDRRQLRALGALQRVSGDTTGHLQAALASNRPDALRWRVYAGANYSQRTGNDVPNAIAVERLIDGPISAIATSRDRIERQWTAGASVRPPDRAGRHAFSFDGELSRVSTSEPPASARLVYETLAGEPARIWSYGATARHSARHGLNVSLLAQDRIALSPRVAVDAAVRLDLAHGSARGAAQGISWRSVLPGARLRWRLGTPLDLAVLTGLRRSAHRLGLDLLSVGDPGSTLGEVYRWDARPDIRGPLIARVGPGAAADPAFSAIDPTLQRPHTDEFVVGLESRPRPQLSFAVTGVARRQTGTVQLVNVGVTADDYGRFTIADANADLVGASDDQQLQVYDRLPASFGRDRYLLTNPALADPTLGALVIAAAVRTDRLRLSIGATAAAAVGSGANRGFRVAENDADVIGEVGIDPNAGTNARGRLFNDRAYTIKSLFVYRLPRAIRLGVIARYQDGQPFTRLVIVPGLQQGAEAIQSFPRGRSRFAFTGTLDVRLQKRLTLGRARVDVMLDVYNLPNMRKETEEDVVTGPRFRETTAVQPPRSAHLGLRVTF